MGAVETVSPEVDTAPVLSALGIPRSSYYRARSPRPPGEPKRRPTPPRALTPPEREDVLAVLHSDRFADSSPHQVQAALLEEGRYLCATRTMYRLLDAAKESRERRDQLQHPHYPRPELVATRPNQVWSWDITKLLGSARGIYYYLYVILDIFSRYAVGWMLALQENAALAERLVAETYTKQGILEGQLTLHADRGSPMRSLTLAELLLELGVAKTFSRPRVSNDNPYSESHFKTLKNWPGFPDRFDSPAHAHEVCRALFPRYNHRHHHSGLCYLTPATVHHGRAEEVLARRHQARLAAFHQHPERFVGGPPRLERLPAAVWINRPEEAARQIALGTTQTGPDDPEVLPRISTYEVLVNPVPPEVQLMSEAAAH
jgi:putative transposase